MSVSLEDSPSIAGRSGIRARVLAFVRHRLAADPPPIRLRFRDGESFDLGPDPTVTIAIHSPRVLRALLTGDMGRLGDLYVAGDLTVEGPIDDVMKAGIRLAKRIGRHRGLSLVGKAAAWLPRNPLKRRTRRSDAEAISQHYDVSNDFYRLWLDRRMVYSCAYFRTGREGIARRRRTSSTTSAASSGSPRAITCSTSAAAGADCCSSPPSTTASRVSA